MKTQSVPELVSVAQSHFTDLMADLVDASGDELTALTVTLELAAIDLFSAFESRMQHHFKRGPFSRKLRNKLLDAGNEDLAHCVYQYYLAINVLKHGTGASFRELRDDQGSMFVLRQPQPVADENSEAVGLVDVTVAGFFDGLTQTILDAYGFLDAN